MPLNTTRLAGEGQRLLASLKGVLLVAVVSLMSHSASAQVAVWTQHNDNSRTGANTHETLLTPQSVKNSFGKLFTYRLDDQTYSQPLYIPNVVMSVDAQRHDVVLVTTVNNSVYAWDADSNTANGGRPLWHKNLTPSGARPPNVEDMDMINACGGNYHDFAANFGIVGTPVIDTDNSAMYIVARTVEQGVFVQRLHALDIRNGNEILGGPVVISGAYKGVKFDPQLQNQRAALALVKGVVYIAWSSHCDAGEYHGWVMGYNTSNLGQVTAWNDTPSGSIAGIWQGGQGATVDEAGNLYFLTGNGTADGKDNFGESAIQLIPNAAGVLNIGQYFTPSNYLSLNNGDTDLGSAGAVLIPGTSLLVGGGKQGMIYVINTHAMGGINTGAQDNVVQEFQATSIQNGGPSSHIHGGPVFFNGGPSVQYLYVWGENDYLRAYRYSNPHNDFSPNGAAQPRTELLFNSTAVAHSSLLAPQVDTGMPGGFLSTSSNGTSDGIVWALTPHACDSNGHVEPGALFAFDATSFSGSGTPQILVKLWDSTQNLARDDVGYFAKFTYPTVAAGRVYVGSWGSVPAEIEGKCSESSQPAAPSNEGLLVVYGLNDALLSASGKITFLRANDVGTGFGPPDDFLDTEIEVQLDSQPGKSFGFQLRADNEEYARTGMLGTLRSAFRSNSTVVIDYFRTGTNNGRIIRVAKEK